MDFIALDLETANFDYSSICQIGIAFFNDNTVVDNFKSYVNPEDFFDSWHVERHGISEDMVEDAPIFSEIYKEIKDYIESKHVIHHTAFDRVSIARACEKYSLENINVNWIDSAKIVRRTWNQFSKSGYGLENMTETLGIKFIHHDALEDATAAGKVVIEASKIKEIDTIEKWIPIVKHRITTKKTYDFNALEINENGEFWGESIVFTGSLSIPRKDAALKASSEGFKVSENVNNTTTYLVVGIQDSDRLKGFKKSTKHRKAEKLIQSGNEINILSEKDFYKLIDIQ